MRPTSLTWQGRHWISARRGPWARATQVAFSRAGYYLQVDLDQLIGTATTTPCRALRTAETWAGAARLPEPYRAAVCALADAGVSVAQMRRCPAR